MLAVAGACDVFLGQPVALGVTLDHREPAAGRDDRLQDPHCGVPGGGADLQRFARTHAFCQEVDELPLNRADQRQATVMRAVFELIEDWGALGHEVGQVVFDGEVGYIIAHVVPPCAL